MFILIGTYVDIVSPVGEGMDFVEPEAVSENRETLVTLANKIAKEKGLEYDTESDLWYGNSNSDNGADTTLEISEIKVV